MPDPEALLVSVFEAPPQALPDRRLKLTAVQHFRGNASPLAAAFLHCERLAPRTRKLAAEEWDAEFQLFKTRER